MPATKARPLRKMRCRSCPACLTNPKIFSEITGSTHGIRFKMNPPIKPKRRNVKSPRDWAGTDAASGDFDFNREQPTCAVRIGRALARYNKPADLIRWRGFEWDGNGEFISLRGRFWMSNNAFLIRQRIKIDVGIVCDRCRVKGHRKFRSFVWSTA